MPVNLFRQLTDLESDFNYAHDDGRYALKVGLVATLYFWEGHTKPVRDVLVDCFEDYQRLFGEHLKWGWNPLNQYPMKLANKKFPNLRTYVETLDKDDCIEWYLDSSKDDESVDDYRVQGITRRAWQGKLLSYFQFTMPWRSLQHPEPAAFHTLLTKFCQRLKPFHGLAGLGTLMPHQDDSFQWCEFEDAQRYFALDVGPGFSLARRVSDGIKSVNWYTILGRELTNKLGGARALKAQLNDPAIQLHEVGETILIQAGDLPILGPVAEGRPPLYVKVNEVLRAVRAADLDSLHSGSVTGALHFNPRTTNLWLRRFDADGIWPPYGPDALAAMDAETSLDASSSEAASTEHRPPRLRVAGGEACPQAGYWFTPAKSGSRKYFEQGELMPDFRSQYGDTIWQWDEDQA